MRPDDGAVLGFRFALSEDSEDAAKPRGDAEFDAVCGRTDAKKDRKRIALSVDFGNAADAPGDAKPPKARTACAQVADDASAAEALASVAEPLRYNSDALLCAIDGYPERGCGEQESEKAEKDGNARKDTPSAGGSSESDGGLGPVAGIGAAVAVAGLLAAAAIRQTRRRR
ncbi:MAG TPA: SCO2322 family protein [Streptomyces sp.]|nr:SCO2322 family protein [Streptomyces sp.]